MRSLWVQGYTVGCNNFLSIIQAFPVGTGIYRQSESNEEINLSVPCGYRDIPNSFERANRANRRSLWVQGYTDFLDCDKLYLYAFPVGTGIYRQRKYEQAYRQRVPCGYRDIPRKSYPANKGNRRSLWVQGYTGSDIVQN